MPINWNEVDKFKLKHIQQQEAAKTKYEEDLKKSSEIVNIVEEYENNINIFRQESMKMFKEFYYKN